MRLRGAVEVPVGLLAELYLNAPLVLQQHTERVLTVPVLDQAVAALDAEDAA